MPAPLVGEMLQVGEATFDIGAELTAAGPQLAGCRRQQQCIGRHDGVSRLGLHHRYRDAARCRQAIFIRHRDLERVDPSGSERGRSVLRGVADIGAKCGIVAPAGTVVAAQV